MPPAFGRVRRFPEAFLVVAFFATFFFVEAFFVADLLVDARTFFDFFFVAVRLRILALDLIFAP